VSWAAINSWASILVRISLRENDLAANPRRSFPESYLDSQVYSQLLLNVQIRHHKGNDFQLGHGGDFAVHGHYPCIDLILHLISLTKFLFN
jgi:hypothetical protein